MKNVLSTATSGDEMAAIQGAFLLSVQCRTNIPNVRVMR